MSDDKLYLPRRIRLVILSQIGFMVAYTLRVNLSVAIVSMVNSTYVNSKPDPECFNGKNFTIKPNNGEFNWDGNQQGLVLGAFFYGYILTQIPGGWLSKQFGGKHVFGIGILITTLLTLITPVAARTSFPLLIAIRVVEGIGEGVTFPAMHAMLGQWSPPSERTRMTVISYSGQHLGTIISLLISGILASSTFLGGWPSVFYVFGVFGILWFLLWTYYAANSPQEDKTISAMEREYIINSLKGCSSNASATKTPWQSIFLSIHVWAIIVATICHCWVWYMVLTGLPTYFEEVLNFQLKQNGFLSALPFLVGVFFWSIAGFAADKIRENILSTQNTRRLFSLMAFFPSGGFLIAASYAGCDQITFSVTCMVLATAFLCLNSSAYSVNHLDIAPRFSGILMGITNSFGTIPGFLTPAITGYFTNKDPTRAQYRKVFAIAAGICAFGGIFFMLFVSGNQQPWNDIGKKHEGQKQINSADDFPDESDPLIPKYNNSI